MSIVRGLMLILAFDRRYSKNDCSAMIISSRKKFIFFHTPKVAGSSLNAALRKYANIPSSRLYNYLLDYVGTSKFFGVYPRHISPFQLSKYLPERKFNSYTKFAFVRNPFDWHVSQYHFHRQNDFAVFYPIFKEMDFDEYLIWAKDNVHLSKSNQYEFLSDGNGQLMVDFIGKIETIERNHLKRSKPSLELKQNFLIGIKVQGRIPTGNITVI